jgi:hypothetical protein
MSEDNTKIPVTNPYGNPFNISVTIPNKIKTKLVDSSVLRAFEIWFSFGAAGLSISSSFWTAYFTNSEPKLEKLLLCISIIFTVFTLVFFIIGYYNRYKINKDSKEIELSITDMKQY